MQNFRFHGRKEKRGVHAVYSAVFRLCAAWSVVYPIFHLLGVRGVFCGCFGREKIYSLFIFLL